LRILVVTNGYPPRGQWGTEFYTAQLVATLRERGVEIAVLHPDRSSDRPRYTVEQSKGTDGTPVYLLHNPGAADKRFDDSYENEEVDRRFGVILDEWQPDLVHFTYLLWGLSIGMPRVARERGVATVATLTDYGLLCHRGQMYDWKLERCEGPHPASVCARCIRTPSRHDDPPLTVLAKRLAIGALAAVGGAGKVVVESDVARREERVGRALESIQELIAPTRVLADKFRSLGVDESKLTELVYSIDSRPLELARAEPPRAPVVFGFLGQFTPHKGLETLLEAVRIAQTRLPESVEDWAVRLYGKPAGGRHRLFAQRVFAGDLGPRVQVMDPFPPHRAPEILSTLHAVLIPSEWDENAPLTCLQARAAGIPLIGTNVRGIAEVVPGPEYGRLVDVGDAEGLADAMREVILGRLGRHPQPTLPMTLEEHADRVAAIHARALGARL
jgi:glycosyltransferase involved in cell wall biosynthesis